MKNLKFLVIALALVIGISSCKKEEKSTDDNNTIKSRIIGTWILQKTETNEFENGVLKFTDNEVEKGENSTEFKNDGTLTATDNNGISSGIYTITNNGKSLNITTEGKALTFEIRAIIPTDLELYREAISTTGSIARKLTLLYSFRRK